MDIKRFAQDTYLYLILSTLALNILISFVPIQYFGFHLGVTMDHLLNGNQMDDIREYQKELACLMEGCNSCEKRIIYEVALATKKVLLESKCSQ